MTPLDEDLRDAAVAAADRRARHAEHLLPLVPALAGTCRAMAGRFRTGALLRPTGVGVSAVDAAHVTVEFLHPVIVGKRAVPALTLDPAQVEEALPDSVVLALRLDDVASVREALATAQALGCLTVDLTATRGGGPADHVLALGTDDVLVARELQVTAYHLLWELVHEYLDAVPPTAGRGEDDLASLYPFLDGTPQGAAPADLDLGDSTERKIREVGALRAEVLDAHVHQLVDASAALAGAGTVWTFGNGGSCTDASAIARLLGDHGLPGRPRRARALSDDVATVTALTNDVRFDVVFARMLRTVARPGDVAIGFSTSGSSANVVEGLAAAHQIGCTTIGFAGYDGGDLAGLDGLDHLLVAPSSSVHRIQEAQTTLAHVLVELVRMQ